MRPLSPSAFRILKELVALPSVNPVGSPTAENTGEAAMASWVGEYLRQLGADIEFHLLAPERPSVVAVFEPPGHRPNRTIALVPHLDTVGVEGMTVPPFTLTRRGDRLHGRGACDTKGPTAALLSAIAHCVRRREFRSGSVRWLVTATAGEEEGGAGAAALLKGGFKADFAVALEPTSLRIVHAAKGILRVWLKTSGHAAHGATPHRGDNAIYKLAPLLEALRSTLIPALAAQRDPLLGEVTLNVGLISGGVGFNVVPDEARVGLDIRTHTSCGSKRVLELLRDLVKQQGSGAEILLHRDAPAFSTDRGLPDVATLRSCGRGWAVADWFCDANVFAHHGIPAVAFGPGSIKQAHTHDEFIERQELEMGVHAFKRFLISAGRPL